VRTHPIRASKGLKATENENTGAARKHHSIGGPAAGGEKVGAEFLESHVCRRRPKKDEEGPQPGASGARDTEK